MSEPTTPKEWLRKAAEDWSDLDLGMLINALANGLTDQQIREALNNSCFMEEVPQ